MAQNNSLRFIIVNHMGQDPILVCADNLVNLLEQIQQFYERDSFPTLHRFDTKTRIPDDASLFQCTKCYAVFDGEVIDDTEPMANVQRQDEGKRKELSEFALLPNTIGGLFMVIYSFNCMLKKIICCRVLTYVLMFVFVGYCFFKIFRRLVSQYFDNCTIQIVLSVVLTIVLTFVININDFDFSKIDAIFGL